MKNKAMKYINKRLEEITDDERFHYEPANVITNAPLALIQTDLKARFEELNKIKELLKK